MGCCISKTSSQQSLEKEMKADDNALESESENDNTTKKQSTNNITKTDNNKQKQKQIKSSQNNSQNKKLPTLVKASSISETIETQNDNNSPKNIPNIAPTIKEEELNSDSDHINNDDNIKDPEINDDDIKLDNIGNKEKCVNGVKFGKIVASTKAGSKNGKVKTNQDSYFIVENLGDLDDEVMQYIGVADGHGPDGHKISQWVSITLPQLLTQDKSTINSLINNTKETIINTFKLLEKKLISEKNDGLLLFDINYSGTTITSVLRVGNKLYFINLGDSRTLLGSYDDENKINMIAMSNDHDPKNENELKRVHESKAGELVDDDGDVRIIINMKDDEKNKEIKKSNTLTVMTDLPSFKRGGKRSSIMQKSSKKEFMLRGKKKINQVSCSVTRSIGDKIAHDYGGVISIPEIIIKEIDINKDIFIICASDGIFTVIENDEVGKLLSGKVIKYKNDDTLENIQKMMDKFVKEANIVWMDEYEDYIDDITAVMATIDTPKNDVNK